MIVVIVGAFKVVLALLVFAAPAISDAPGYRHARALVPSGATAMVRLGLVGESLVRGSAQGLYFRNDAVTGGVGAAAPGQAPGAGTTGTESGKKETGKAKTPKGEPDSGNREDQKEEPEAQPEAQPELKRATTPEVSFGYEDVRVDAGEYHSGDLVSIGGRVTVHGQVRGSIVVVGGVLDLSGNVRGDVVGVGSRITLHDGAKIRGNTVSVAGHVEKKGEIEIGGDFTAIDFIDLGRFASGKGAISWLLHMLFWLAILTTAIRFLGVLVVAAIGADRIEGALAEPRPSWILAFLLGFVVRIVTGILILILILPCVTLPVAVALWIILRIVVWMGLASISLHIGRIVGRSFFNADLSYFGAILTGFLVVAVAGFIPILGPMVSWIISCSGLGLMLLTRFGAKRKPPVRVDQPLT